MLEQSKTLTVRPVTALNFYQMILDGHPLSLRTEDSTEKRRDSIHRHSITDASSSSSSLHTGAAGLSLQKSKQSLFVSLSPILPMLMIPIESKSAVSSPLVSVPDWLYLGPRTGRITEISGEAGTGKTQLGLSLCVSMIHLPWQTRVPKMTDKMYIPSKYEEKHEQENCGGKDGFRKESLPKKARLCSMNNQDPSISNVMQTRLPVFDSQRQSRGAMYVIMGESVKPSKIAHRLYQMVSSRWTEEQRMDIGSKSGGMEKETFIQNTLQRIQTKCLYNSEQFLEFLDHHLPSILEQEQQSHVAKTGLIVLDSIAGLYRTREDEHRNDQHYYTHRSKDLFYISSRLKYISDQFGIQIVVINQVTVNGKGIQVPSLGLSWSCCVNDRYMLLRREMGQDFKDNTTRVTRTKCYERRIHLLSSSQWGQCDAVAFQIEDCGVVMM